MTNKQKTYAGIGVAALIWFLFLLIVEAPITEWWPMVTYFIGLAVGVWLVETVE